MPLLPVRWSPPSLHSGPFPGFEAMYSQLPGHIQAREAVADPSDCWVFKRHPQRGENSWPLAMVSVPQTPPRCLNTVGDMHPSAPVLATTLWDTTEKVFCFLTG